MGSSAANLSLASSGNYTGGTGFIINAPGGILTDFDTDGFSTFDAAFTLTYADIGVEVAEGGDGYALKLADLPFTDIDSPNSAISFTVADGPDHGHFELRDGTTTTETTFTYAQVAAGDIFYVHDGSSLPGDKFSLGVSDGSTTSVETIDVAVAVDSDGFLGDTFHYRVLFPGKNTVHRPDWDEDVTASSGVELANFDDASVDFTEDQIIITYNTGGTYSSASFNGQHLQDLFDDLVGIANVQLNAASTITPASIEFDENNIWTNMAGVAIGIGQKVILDVTFM
jgi:hypothetical protein